MLKLPEFIPDNLRDELESIQQQIKVLISNYKILNGKVKRNPEDETAKKQLKTVQKFLWQFNQKQAPVLARIREIVKEKKNDEEKKIRCEGNKLSMKDRMAMVRGMRKKRRRGGGAGPRRTPAARTPSPSFSAPVSVVSESVAAAESGDWQQNLILPNQYKAHVSSQEKFSNYVDFPLDDETDPIQRLETVLSKCDQPQFLLNLELYTPVDVSTVVEFRRKWRQKQIEYRNLTYIPEISDRKHKSGYNYLAPDLNSPPLLRTRQRRSNTATVASSRVTSRSASNSRASSPELYNFVKPCSSPLSPSPLPLFEDDESSSVVPSLEAIEEEDSQPQRPPEPLLVDEDEHMEDLVLEEDNASPLKEEELSKEVLVEKDRLEGEIEAQKKRCQELSDILESNKRTVATRKERMRQSELTEEHSGVVAKIQQLKDELDTLISS